MTAPRSAAVLLLFTPLCLVACASAGRTAPGASSAPIEAAAMDVRVYFNHQYSLVTRATLEALQNSAYLKDAFVDVEVRTTVRPDLTYTGTYLNLRDTYLEFFPEGTWNRLAGVSGMGLGDEEAGGIEKVAAAWAKAFGPKGVGRVEPVSHALNGVQVPWFKAVDALWSDSSKWSGLWHMEYFPNAGATAPRTRREERAARYQPAKLAQNVDALLYALPEDDRENLRRSFQAVGWKISPDGPGFVALTPVDAGTSRAIAVQPSSDGRIGLRGILFRLNRQASHTEQLGDAELTIGLRHRPYAVLWLSTPTPEEAARLEGFAQ